ncbi:MAG: hypothetical protein JSR27_12190 [Proteobacteria bacterium]|nr:hypothetical protein [Pseudomonadota bacterium]
MNTPGFNESRLPPWTDRAKALLDESVHGLDAATLSRLNRARQAALAQRGAPRRPGWAWMPAGLATACALLLAVGVWQARMPHTATPTATPPSTAATQGASMNAADLDMIASDDNLEMMQDLDFYAWLDAQDQDNNG